MASQRRDGWYVAVSGAGAKVTPEQQIADYISSYGTLQTARYSMANKRPDLLPLFDDLEKSGRLKAGGHMYEVNINADPAHMMDWDKPLRDQPHVQDALADMMLSREPSQGVRTLRRVNEDVDFLGGKSGNILYRKFSTNPREASAMLNEAGIPARSSDA